ncbi:hypothetical protein CO180_04650 [candidate division WWE3 bacterium CG_4_9_14_3_um_filter_41_6]|uniref:Uncharacterized protein n=1 Tax=candidate division WWE3 bacterium CG_4_10_14_0_2_um_filter_41_14 TaxID=1975072 RepID=A0A2M7TEL9_UNCKA|nr:MAG: hypothetical protein COY32_07060 [candidate division WWE3 bacterium CG_4_10_14_0_2_um_filter_41_14]PJA37918.1 MAG: hypothetical protein CO180_04650 [candidate division WWE3 bacterium CG_4_9_14_3_um_filter_41_6]
MSKKTLIITSFTIAVIIGVLFGVISVQKTLKKAQIDEYINRATTAKNEQHYVDAFNLMSLARKLDQQDTSLIIRQADIAFLNGDYDVSQTLYLEAGVTQNPQLLFTRALSQLSRGNFSSAVDILTQAQQSLTEQDPLTTSRITALITSIAEIMTETNSPKIQALTARTLIGEKAYTYSIEVLNNLITSEPQYKDAYYLRAVSFYSQGNASKSRTDANAALDIDPNYKAARDLLAKLDDSK